jgi:hypothetical protein
MAVTAGVLVYYFYRKGWLDREARTFVQPVKGAEDRRALPENND